MKKNEAITYLTRCAQVDGAAHWSGGYQHSPESCPTCHGTNDAGHLRCPCSRYGATSRVVAETAWQCAKIDAEYNGDPTKSMLDHFMGLAVNDSEIPQEVIQDHWIEISGANVDGMVEGYVTCQLWAQMDFDSEAANGERNFYEQGWSVDDVSQEYVDKITAEFRELVAAHPLAVRMYLGRTTVLGNMRNVHDEQQFGHDWYLTREHHGAGFWDRGLGDLGAYLTDLAHWAGSADDLYVSTNGEELTA